MAWIDGFTFALTDEEQMVKDAARSFAQSEVAPLAVKIDREHYYPVELIPQLGALGFMGAAASSEFGGSELSQVAYCMMIEELAAACASTAIIVSAHNSLCLWPVATFGTPEQKLKFVGALARGEKLGCFALSEPSTGSDAANLSCTVKKEGDNFIVNGTKNWITNAPKAGICVLLANQEPTLKHKGITAFVHPLDMPGISLGKLEDKLGICGSPTSSISYDQVKMPREFLLGEELGGFKIAMQILNGGRTGVAAQAIGIARAALFDALTYAKDRKTFGKPICQHQSIQNYLADMITKIDAARFLTLSAARLKDQKKPFVREAAQAKLFASETAMEAAIKGIQIHGGYGYVKDFPAERHLRDAKITEIYEGTSEIQRLLIAEMLLKD